MKRKGRKNCVYFRGISYYDFDFNKEFAVYKYLCGEKLTRRQWKYIDEDNSFNFYEEWENYIRKKCQDYDKSKLREFCHYIEYRKFIVEPRMDYWKVTFSAFVSCALFGGLNSLLDEADTWIFSPHSGATWETILLITLCIISICLATLLMIPFLNKISFGNIERHFLEDYKSILQELLKEREKK